MAATSAPGDARDLAAREDFDVSPIREDEQKIVPPKAR
jgi:hypothetical protein